MRIVCIMHALVWANGRMTLFCMQAGVHVKGNPQQPGSEGMSEQKWFGDWSTWQRKPELWAQWDRCL